MAAAASQPIPLDEIVETELAEERTVAAEIEQDAHLRSLACAR